MYTTQENRKPYDRIRDRLECASCVPYRHRPRHKNNSYTFTVTVTDSVILVDATTAVFQATLPTAVGITGE